MVSRAHAQRTNTHRHAHTRAHAPGVAIGAPGGLAVLAEAHGGLAGGGHVGGDQDAVVHGGGGLWGQGGGAVGWLGGWGSSLPVQLNGGGVSGVAGKDASRGRRHTKSKVPVKRIWSRNRDEAAREHATRRGRAAEGREGRGICSYIGFAFGSSWAERRCARIYARPHTRPQATARPAVRVQIC